MKKSKSSRQSRCACTVQLFFLLILVSLLAWPMVLLAENEKAQKDDLSLPVLEEETTSGDSGFSISLKIFNPDTEKSQSTFYFGDTAGYQAGVSIPPTAEGKQATVTLTATVKVGGVTLPFTTSQVFSGPITNPTYKKDVDLFEPRTWKGKFKMPSEIPVSELTATVKLVVTIKDIGTSTINKKITIKTKQKLPKPTLNNPLEGAQLNIAQVCGTSLYRAYWYFNWNDVPWATKYEIAINDKFDSSTTTYETDSHYFSSTGPCTDINHKDWTWKVRAGNEYCWSSWSEVRHFTVNYPTPPNLLSPVDGALMDNGCYSYTNQTLWTFDWTDVVGPSVYYNLVVYHVGSPSQLINTYLGSSWYNYTTFEFIPDSDRHNWKWKVRAQVGGAWSDWSEERSFTVEPVNTDCP